MGPQILYQGHFATPETQARLRVLSTPHSLTTLQAISHNRLEVEGSYLPSPFEQVGVATSFLLRHDSKIVALHRNGSLIQRSTFLQEVCEYLQVCSKCGI